MDGFKSRGSIGVPPEIQKQLNEARTDMARRGTRPAQPPPHPSQVHPAAAAPEAPVVPQVEPPPPPASPETEKAKAEEEQRKKFQEVKAQLEQSLGLVIEPDDIKDYVFKGRLTKDVQIIPGVLKATFQTQNPTEFMEIDEKMANLRNEMKFTPEGLDNQKAILNLSYSWVAANDKPLSAKSDPVVRENYIRKMGNHIVDVAAQKLTELNMLLRMTLQEKTFIKKS